jgi:hypothetical protein
MMMRCRDLRRLSTRYLEGELSAEGASAARGHLRDCEACRAVLEDEAAIASAARALAGEAEPAAGWDVLWSRIGAQVAEKERADAARPWWAHWWRARRGGIAMALTAAAAAALVLVAWPRLPPTGGGVAHHERAATTAKPSDPEEFLRRAEREIARADGLHAGAVDDLRRLAARERGTWSEARVAELDAALAELDERLALARRGLAVMGVPKPHARDELYGIYREQIAVLQRAVVGAPLAAAGQPGAGARR